MERDVDVGGVRLHCRVEGEGPLLLLLHGFPETSRAWRKQIPALAARFQVVAPDLRGFGASDKPKGVDAYRTPAALANDVVALVDAFEADRAHIVGHDWGGGVAWAVATLAPEVVDRLAVLNCPHPAVMQRALRSNWTQIRKSWYFFASQLPWLPEWALSRKGGRPVESLAAEVVEAGDVQRGPTSTNTPEPSALRARRAAGSTTTAPRSARACRPGRSRRRRFSSGLKTISRSA
jgi:pimeloyl-ACP methyl ester carboxylesterase